MPLSPCLSHILPHHIPLPVVGGNPVESCPRLQGKESLQAPLKSKWEEPNLPDVPKPHSLFATAWQEADMNSQRIKSGVVDPGNRFLKPTLFVNVSMPEKKKTYLLNWLSARPLWISQDIFGEAIINSAQGLTGAPQEIMWWGMQGSITSVLAPLFVSVSSFSDPPLSFMQSLLWELYELNFQYELYVLNWALAPDHWTTSNKEQITHQTLLYSIFPGKSGLVMWLESLPCHLHDLGLCATDMPTSLPYVSKFCQLLSVWPGAPACLQSPVKLEGQDNMEVYNSGDFMSQILSGDFKSHIYTIDFMSCRIPGPSGLSTALAQLPDVAANAPSSLSHNQASMHIPGALCLNDSASAATSQLHNMASSIPSSSSGIQVEPCLLGPRPIFVPPPLARHCCPPHMKGLYLPAPPPVFILPGRQCLAQDPSAMPHHHHHPPASKPDIFDYGNEFQFNNEVVAPSGKSALQKREIQWWQWSQDVIPALLNPYLQYLQASESLRVVVDSQVDHPTQCLEEIKISYCACTPAPVHLMEGGLFACSPVTPTLAVDLHVLEFMRTLFVWLTPNTTTWCEALESFLDAQGYQLQSKFTPPPPKPLYDEELGFNLVNTYVPIVHYVLVKRTNNPQKCATNDPPNPTSIVFIPESEVKAMEMFVEKQRSLPPGHHDSSHQLQGDSFENGMRVPMSVLDGCGDSFHAADENRKKASTNFFADTGLMALLCHHDHVLWLVNMTSAGEKQHYALVLLKYLFEHLPTTITVGLLYDIGCQLECSCCKWKLLDEGILLRLKFGISVFHAYGHQWPCQIVYHPPKCVGFGLSDGEGLVEQEMDPLQKQENVGFGVPCALHIDMQILWEEWAAQVHSQTQPLPWQSKNKGAKLLAHILSLEKSVQDYQSHVDQLEMDLVNDHHTAAKNLLSKATKALQQKKSALGVSEKTDLYLLRNNKECLQQCKFELEHLEGSSRNSANDNHLQSHLQKVPPGAIPHLSIPTKGIFQLDVDSDIWQDCEPGEGSSAPPQWLADETVHKGIRLMLEIDHCNEEERRLSREWSVLQEWFSMEWKSLHRALENEDWKAKVQYIPHAWVPSENWGPTGEDVANYLAPERHTPSVEDGAELPTDDLSEGYEFDPASAISEGDDELLLGIEEMALEGGCNMGHSDEEGLTDDEGWLGDVGNVVQQGVSM
ncbi:hypothetical protein EDC04DRAFT_2609524 [Pisolithus marmoratus]|nr:hypothetical protein EDC04DRAFT_2609524 [Pisolithus marmoratus]